MDRKNAIYQFRTTSQRLTPEMDPELLSTVIDRLLDQVEVIQATQSHGPCEGCRAHRLCQRKLAVPISTRCEVCNKAIIFVVPASSESIDHWDKPVSRISDSCPHARPKTHFAWCPQCRKDPERVALIQKRKEFQP